MVYDSVSVRVNKEWGGKTQGFGNNMACVTMAPVLVIQKRLFPSILSSVKCIVFLENMNVSNNESAAFTKGISFCRVELMNTWIVKFESWCTEVCVQSWIKCGLKFQFHFPTPFYCLHTLHICEMFPSRISTEKCSVAFSVTNITNLLADTFFGKLTGT